jgi:hypothetical protein
MKYEGENTRVDKASSKREKFNLLTTLMFAMT